MTTDTVLTEGDAMSIMAEFGEHNVEHGYGRYDKWQALDAARAIEQAVLQSPEVAAVRRNTLLSVLGKLNSNPYNLTKSECIDVVREMFEEADAAMEKQP